MADLEHRLEKISASLVAEATDQFDQVMEAMRAHPFAPDKATDIHMRLAALRSLFVAARHLEPRHRSEIRKMLGQAEEACAEWIEQPRRRTA